MHRVRTTMQPHIDVEVNDAELLDLERQGLLVQRPSDSAPAAAPAKTPTSAKAKEADR
ncbi:hypothetical protein [Streptomyces malaysiensis]|uniref:Uncharacterized protein n=1 Tax=Streptomyces malaysiensis subsp. samsunensis TaxID=459658 RepID=A0A9X2LYE4_STRMQ|nr:hypothetical protein [Streptomyces samsunensis]MCQ8831758.1 hypothetical protein [Streptomyces samsunensis]